MIDRLGNKKLLAAAFGALTVGLVVAGFLFAKPKSNSTMIAAPIGVAEARALGARWRQEGGVELGRRYAEALLASGLNDKAIEEIRENNLLAEDLAARRLFEAEALLRRGEFAAAGEVSSPGADANEPYAAFIRARANYAGAGDAADFERDLANAFRGPNELAVEAWLLRSRLALDANEFETAAAAGRRAQEAGASASRIESIDIETAIRRGEHQAASAMLTARAERLRKKQPAGAFSDHDAARLDAMLALRLADPGAGRRADKAFLTGTTGREGNLGALIKWASGDHAQAYQIVRTRLGAAPQDWVALDLAGQFAVLMTRAEDARAFERHLENARPALGVLRRLQKDADLDATLSFARRAAQDDAIAGAVESLVGVSAAVDRLAPAASASDAAAIDLMRRLEHGDARLLRKAVETAALAPPTPMLNYLLASAYRRLGDDASAAHLAGEAKKARPDFLAPALLGAQILAQENRRAEAIAQMRQFLEANPANDAAMIALARLYADGGDAGSAMQQLRKAAPSRIFADEDTALFYARTACNGGRENCAQMLASARRTLGPSALLARLHEVAGDKEGAARAWLAALSANTSDPALAMSYLRTMAMLGKSEEARRTLGEILRRHPELTAVGEALAASATNEAKDDATF